MTEDKWILDIPDFTPVYDSDKQYGYTGRAGVNLEKLLRDTSKNHCMYCYALLRNDRVDIGHLEHSVEKSLDEKHLTNCVPNIAIACPNCNQSLKRKGEKKRLEALEAAKERFAGKAECSDGSCAHECEAYSELKSAYCEESQIILQPFGVTGEESEQEYRLQYDIYDAEFKPSNKYNYTSYDRRYIENHISKFKLNDAGFRTKALANFVEDVINADGKYRADSEYPNYIVDLFKDKIVGMNKDELVSLCEQIHIRNLILFKN